MRISEVLAKGYISAWVFTGRGKFCVKQPFGWVVKRCSITPAVHCMEKRCGVKVLHIFLEN